MTIHAPNDEALLRAELIERMRRVRTNQAGGFLPCAVNAFTYSCKTREMLKSVQVAKPSLVVVLRGSKEVWIGDRMQNMQTGTVFVLPRGLKADFANVPDAGAHIYESLIMEIDGLPASVPRLAPSERLMRRDKLAVPLTRDLIEALGHAAVSLSQAEGSATIRALRVAEILMLLRSVPEARPLFEQTLAEDIGWAIRCAPTEPWTVDTVAQDFGMAGSTLRRRLKAEGTSFRTVLRDVRMEVARAALAEGAGSIAAAEASGYVSRSHFARAYRAAYGETPTGRN